MKRFLLFVFLSVSTWPLAAQDQSYGNIQLEVGISAITLRSSNSQMAAHLEENGFKNGPKLLSTEFKKSPKRSGTPDIDLGFRFPLGSKHATGIQFAWGNNSKVIATDGVNRPPVVWKCHTSAVSLFYDLRLGAENPFYLRVSPKVLKYNYRLELLEQSLAKQKGLTPGIGFSIGKSFGKKGRSVLWLEGSLCKGVTFPSIQHHYSFTEWTLADVIAVPLVFLVSGGHLYSPAPTHGELDWPATTIGFHSLQLSWTFWIGGNA